MNKYEIVSKVGEGAYGVVLKCRSRVAPFEIVAIKKFKENQSDPLVAKTTMREVALLSVLKSHTNIVLLKDAFRRKGKLYLVFEYMEKNLLEVIESVAKEQQALAAAAAAGGQSSLATTQNSISLGSPCGGLNPVLIKLYIWQLVKAIAFCHAQGIVHRDIKPENLLVSPENGNRLALCDFGFARKLNQQQQQQLHSNDDSDASLMSTSDEPLSPATNSTANGSKDQQEGDMTDYVATRWYRAPELLLGSTSYGTAVDIWAIACILGELTDSQPLFPGETELDQLAIIQHMLGPLTESQLELWHRNSRFASLQPAVASNYRPPTSATLERRYNGKMSRHALQFMKQILVMDETKRLTAKQCLAHPWFESMRKMEREREMQLQSGVGASSDERVRTPNAATATIESTTMTTLPAPSTLRQKSQTSNNSNDSQTSQQSQSSQQPTFTMPPIIAPTQQQRNSESRESRIRDTLQQDENIKRFAAAATQQQQHTVLEQTSHESSPVHAAIVSSTSNASSSSNAASFMITNHRRHVTPPTTTTAASAAAAAASLASLPPPTATGVRSNAGTLLMLHNAGKHHAASRPSTQQTAMSQSPNATQQFNASSVNIAPLSFGQQQNASPEQRYASLASNSSNSNTTTKSSSMRNARIGSSMMQQQQQSEYKGIATATADGNSSSSSGHVTIPAGSSNRRHAAAANAANSAAKITMVPLQQRNSQQQAASYSKNTLGGSTFNPQQSQSQQQEMTSRPRSPHRIAPLALHHPQTLPSSQQQQQSTQQQQRHATMHHATDESHFDGSNSTGSHHSNAAAPAQTATVRSTTSHGTKATGGYHSMMQREKRLSRDLTLQQPQTQQQSSSQHYSNPTASSSGNASIAMRGGNSNNANNNSSFNPPQLMIFNQRNKR